MKTAKRNILATILAILLAMGLTGCGVNIESIGLPADLVLEKGESQQLEIEYGTTDEASTAEVEKAAEELTLMWSSSDESVVTVDEAGLVTAVGAGEADVTVTAEKVNVSSTTHIKVVILPQGLSSPESMTLELNGENSKALDAVMTPEDATEVKLAYESSDETIATVSEDGTVTAVGVGECTITTTIVADVQATAETAEDTDIDSEMLVVPENARAETKVTVVKVMEDIILNSNEGILNVGNTYTIKATVVPEDATDKTITWTSSDQDVATVDDTGKVTAKEEGKTTITVSNSSGTVNVSYELTVKKVICSYCGQTGHTSANCPVKAADQQRAAAAAQQAAAQQAAQQQQQANQAAQSGGDSGGGDVSAPSAPDPVPAPDPEPSGDSGSSGGISHPEADIPGVIITDANGDGRNNVDNW